MADGRAAAGIHELPASGSWVDVGRSNRPRSATQPLPLLSSRPGRIDITPEAAFTPQEITSSFTEDEGEKIRADDAESVIGVSIGPEQTRLTSPSTPAAEKSAALDRMNSWGFFDDGIEDEQEQEEVLRNTIQNSLPPEPQTSDCDPVSSPDMHQEKVLPLAPKPRRPDLPSPWTAGPKGPFVRESGSKDPSRSAGNRIRANSANILGDGTFKRFFSSLTFPSIPEPKMLRDMTRSFELRQSAGTATGHERSASLLNARFPWQVSQTSQTATQRNKSRSGSRDTSPGLGSRKTSGPQNVQHSSLQQPAAYDGTGARTPLALERTHRSSTSLRRSVSDESLVRRSLSRASTLEEMQSWDHVSTQANTRMKAIKDSLSDSLPSLPLINFAALKPEFGMKREGSGSQTAMSSVFGAGSLTNRSRQNSDGSMHSPPKFTRPKHPIFEDALDGVTGDVVIMGGYRGSVLRSADPPHRQLWVPVKVGLNIRKVNLEVGLNPEDEENMHKHIWPSGMLTHIGPVDMSQRLFKKLRNCRNAKEGKLRVHDYGYDWRLSPHLLSRRLVQFLDNLDCNAPGTHESEKGATVIAHSLGGLITRHAVNQRPDLFAGVLYAGVPQHCVNILGPFRKGDEVLLSSKVLTAQVNFTFRTSFLLLPDSGQCFIDKDTNEHYNVDFFDPASWSRYAFSPCIAPCLPALQQPERRSILGSISDTIAYSRTNYLPSLSKQESSSERKLELKASDIAHLSDHTLKPQMNSTSPQSTSSTLALASAQAYLARTLSEVRQFRSELACSPQHQSLNAYPPISLMYSTSTPTVYGAKVVGREGIKRADAYDNLAFASGDGVVLARAAMVPRGYKVADGGRVRTERGHVGLLGDLEAVGRCLLAVGNARREGVGLGLGLGKGIRTQEAERTSRVGNLEPVGKPSDIGREKGDGSLF
ncbi:MAG: hypothetical protein MMC23_004125 [Stictis urceolatum]|nr:hypothetical protein [Stictis urceolata]